MIPFVDPSAQASASSGASGVITSIASGVAGIFAAYSAFKVSRRSAAEEDVRAMRDENARLKGRVADLEADLLDLRNYVFEQRAAYADKGVKTPPPPVLRSERSTG